MKRKHFNNLKSSLKLQDGSVLHFRIKNKKQGIGTVVKSQNFDSGLFYRALICLQLQIYRYLLFKVAYIPTVGNTIFHCQKSGKIVIFFSEVGFCVTIWPLFFLCVCGFFAVILGQYNYTTVDTLREQSDTLNIEQ